jgi:pimeloyl-ACP methyl ester carboxylesterase
VKVNGKDLAVEVDGQGPAVLLVHGLGGTSNFYQPQAEAFANHFRVIRPDLEGSGRSPVTGELSIDGLAADLAALLDELGVESARVVGHSMGTLVVRTLAARHPERVIALALLGAVRPPAPAAQEATRARAATVRAQGMAAVAPAIVANATSETTRRDRPEVAAFVRELLMRQDPEGYARNCEALAAATDPGPIDSALPLLLLTGDQDRVGAPDASHELAASHGRARVEVFADIGHWTAIEAARATTDRLVKFLSADLPTAHRP